MNKKELLLISIGIFLTIAAWLIIDIYQIKRKSIQEKNASAIILNNYENSRKVIEVLKNRQL